MALTKINLVTLFTSSELSKFLILPFKIRKVRLYSSVTKWGNVLILYPLCSTPYWKSASLSALLPELLSWHKPVSLFDVCCPVLLASWLQLAPASKNATVSWQATGSRQPSTAHTRRHDLDATVTSVRTGSQRGQQEEEGCWGRAQLTVCLFFHPGVDFLSGLFRCCLKVNLVWLCFIVFLTELYICLENGI